MAVPTEPLYTIQDIASETGVPVKRISKWIYQKLVPPAVSKRNDGICYTPAHLHRVALVKEWVESQVTLEELAERIKILGDRALVVHDPYEGFDGWGSIEDEEDEDYA